MNYTHDGRNFGVQRIVTRSHGFIFMLLKNNYDHKNLVNIVGGSSIILVQNMIQLQKKECEVEVRDRCTKDRWCPGDQ